MKRSLCLAILLVSFPPLSTARPQGETPTASTGELAARRNEIGRPFIRNYSPKEYGAHPQNWAIVQDKRGLMYFGNGLGVLEYDAVSWRLIVLPNKSVVRSLDVDENGRIYVGAQGEFGYLAPDSLGRLQFVSLLGLLPLEERAFTEVWRTFVTPAGVYFQTPTHLFRYVPPSSPSAGSQAKVQVWKPATRFNRASLARNRLYVPQANIGLMQVAGDSLRLLPGTKRFAEEIYGVVLPYPGETDQNSAEKILLATATSGLFLHDGATATAFPTEADDFLRRSEVYRGTLLHDGTFALATRHGGVAIISRDGHARIIDKTAGLRVNKVYFVYPDQQGALWLGLENGISRVETPSPFSFYDESSGVKSTVYDIVRHQGRLYVSTNTGVFYLQTPEVVAPGKRAEFRSVSDLVDQSWYLLAMDDKLLVATGDGVYRIDDGRAVLIKESVSESFVALALHRSRINKNRIYVGLTDGVASLRFDAAGAQWIDEGKISGVYEQIWSILETAEGGLWLGTDAQGVIRVKFPEARHASNAAGKSAVVLLQNPLVERFGVAHGLSKGGVQVFAVAGRDLFATTSGIFRFDEKRGVFFPDSTFAVAGFGNTQEEYNLKEDHDGNVWINFGKESALALRQTNGSFLIEKTPFLRFADSPAIAIHPERDGVVWFGGADGLVRYDRNLARDFSPSYAALIRRVIVDDDSVIFAGVSDEVLGIPVPELPYADNTLRFEFCAPFFEAETENRFQTFLEGFDDRWSAWSREAQTVYTNLPHGDYRFRVRARNIYQHESDEAVYAFTVLSPWYRAWWAYILYLGFFATLILGLVGIRTHQLHARSRELEQTVQERTQEIRQQAQALESQAEELEEKNREILRTQEQLIVQEKLASLGQLTAGIAHEIKNPLNFVNNFAKLSEDLIRELREGFEGQKERLEPSAQGNLEEVLHLLEHNVVKINEHGKRADSIIKGMLLHSRGESGERRPADLNAILDEYVMLAYHGMRGTDSSFNVKIEKSYDPAVGRVEISPQDMSRVFLNLVNNACYATHQKKKQLGESFAPVLSVQTKNLDDHVEIRIRDNGPGIPEHVRSKIFHPFFTTKPAGQGTGLGLSISYDIVVHEHKGEIKVESEEGKFTEFVVRLPRA